MITLADLQGFPFNNATASLWIVKKRIQQKQAKYTARWVEIAGEEENNNDLESQLVSTVNNVVTIQKDDLDYDFVATPDEFCLLKVDAQNTNMPLILDKMNIPGDECQVTSEKELLNAAGYVIHIQAGDESLYAFKKTSSSWTTKKVKASYGAFFRNGCMIGISQESVFQIYKSVDFICYKDTVFISDKRSFESAMNYKESMIERRDEAVTDLEASGIFSSVDSISEFIGEDMRYLRSISSIMDKGFYKNNEFMTRLKNKNQERNWGIEFDEYGKIIPNTDRMPDLFKILNDFRLFSELSHNIYDVPSTQSVA
ncbi:Kiwa anti-phage protein KwaB-like domain-containing protein [Maridesulfovibrio sp.]|uniref:Kiwa anti-phage protein KwaB-like domain-containing protein n=1 Tax=Maridesulfovibrio sp. TaxID=2795000 RepID=UPI002AA7E457|nr:Kiwa anti-phage protein KwaB-like domain-containing protein [Maridesulfovibrio sp.]